MSLSSGVTDLAGERAALPGEWRGAGGGPGRAVPEEAEFRGGTGCPRLQTALAKQIHFRLGEGVVWDGPVPHA